MARPRVDRAPDLVAGGTDRPARARRGVLTAALLLGVGLVLYGTAINLAPLPDRVYLTLNIGAGGIVAVTALDVGGLDASALGVDRPGAWAVILAVALVAAAVLGVVLVLRAAGRSERVAGLLDDDRIAGIDRVAAFERATIRIPIGTAAFEELAFRGALLGMLLAETSTVVAVVGSSVAFGLWHVAPTWQYLRANGVRQRVRPIALGVVATAIGGAVLCVLRLAAGGLLVPWVAHAAVNVGAFVASYRWRQQRPQRQGQQRQRQQRQVQ